MNCAEPLHGVCNRLYRGQDCHLALPLGWPKRGSSCCDDETGAHKVKHLGRAIAIRDGWLTSMAHLDLHIRCLPDAHGH